MNGEEVQSVTDKPADVSVADTTLPASPLANTNPEQAAKTGWVVDKGDPGIWECVCKAHNATLGIFKSTKRMKVDGGYVYQMTTEKFDDSGKYLQHVSECAVFVPTPMAPVVLGVKPNAKPAAKAKGVAHLPKKPKKGKR